MSGSIATGKKSSSRLSGGLGAQSLLRPEKKDTVVCLADARSLLRPEKKRYSRLSGRCAIVITTGKKRYSRLSLVVIIIFVLVQLELNLIQIH